MKDFNFKIYVDGKVMAFCHKTMKNPFDIEICMIRDGVGFIASTLHYRGRDESIEEIAREGVHSRLSGSFDYLPFED